MAGGASAGCSGAAAAASSPGPRADGRRTLAEVEEEETVLESQSSRPPQKRARLTCEEEEEEEVGESCKLQCLLTVRPNGPLDFGGRLAELLWGVHFEYSGCVEYLLLCFRPCMDEKMKDVGARRIERPELHALLRCNRDVRLGTLAAAKARRRTIEPEASDVQRECSKDICDSLRRRYPRSWAAAQGCCGPRPWDEAEAAQAVEVAA